VARARLGRGLGLTLAGLALTAAFSLWLLPWDRYRALAERELSRATGAEVRVGGVGPALGRGIAVLRLRDVEVAFPGGRRLAISELRVRPALSSSWLRLEPALRVLVTSESGALDGTWWLGERAGFAGDVEDLALELLPLEELAAGLALSGRADLSLDLASDAAGLAGEVELAAREGSVAFPPYGLPIPFASARGTLAVAPERGFAIESLELDDPGRLSVRASGTIGAAASAELSPLDLSARLEVLDPALRSLFAQALPLDGNGHAELRLSGTLGAPVVR
jgi:type II secretion system protein N